MFLFLIQVSIICIVIPILHVRKLRFRELNLRKIIELAAFVIWIIDCAKILSSISKYLYYSKQRIFISSIQFLEHNACSISNCEMNE